MLKGLTVCVSYSEYGYTDTMRLLNDHAYISHGMRHHQPNCLAHLHLHFIIFFGISNSI